MRFKIDINRRFKRQHPFDIWEVLTRLQVMDKLQDVEERFFSPEEIGAVLYCNWNDFSESQQKYIASAKLYFPLLCLTTTCFVVEESVSAPNPDAYLRFMKPTVTRYLQRYKAMPNIFRDYGYTKEQVREATRSAIDDKWADWINRR